MMRRQRPVRVVLVIGSANLGGAEHQLVRLACRLSQRSVDVRVLFQVFGGPLVHELDAAGVRWEVLRPARSIPTSLGRNLAMFMRAGWRLLRCQPDVVFAWMPGAVWMSLPLAALLTKATRIAAFRGETPDLGLFTRLFRHSVSRAHAVTVNAPHLREDALAWGATDARVHVIPNGVELPAVLSRVDTQPPTAVVVANYKWYKGHDFLLEALSLIDVPLNVRLIGMGEGRTAVQSRIDQLDLGRWVCFVDQPAEIGVELAAAQFAIHPSRTEGLPNAILEELAAGLPVVATAVGGVPLLIDDEINGFLVPLGEERILAKRISEMAASPELRCKMADRARAKASAFSWDKCVDSYLNLFSELIRGRV